MQVSGHTDEQFLHIIHSCQAIFEAKMHDYGAAWRVLRLSSVTDQIFIKVKRLRTTQSQNTSRVEESPEETFSAIVNYAVIGLMQSQLGVAEDTTADEKMIKEYYQKNIQTAFDLMKAKNNDYGEAWREMRIESITDLIYQKVLRTKQIEDLEGNTLVSEGWESNYLDILIYAVFCLIKLKENEGIS